MLGTKQIVIDSSEFLKGMSAGADAPDGGFSPETDAVNITAVPGVLYGPADVTNKSTGLNGAAIAWCPTNVLSKNGYILDAGGYIYSLDTSQVLTAAASALTGDWQAGTSDIVQFIDKIYATSKTDVAQMGTDLTNGDYHWWSSTLSKGVLSSGARHPLLVWQDRLWVGNLNEIHKITDSATGTKSVLVLASMWEITALGFDPASGKMLIAATQGPNYSNTIASGSRIFTWDGTSATYNREYPVDGMVTAFHSVGSVVYVAYGGTKIGYWNGAGVSFLRNLRNITLAGANLPYKHHLTHIDSTLYVVDGTQVIAYGPVLNTRKIWYPALKNNVNSNAYGLICPVGSKLLGVGFDTAKFYTFDTASVASVSSQVFYSNRYGFRRPVTIIGVYIEWNNAVAAAASPMTVRFFNEKQSATSVTVTNNDGSSVYTYFVPGTSEKVRMFQYQHTITNAVVAGIRRIIIYYDDSAD
jgi:hypothetical protein